MKRKMKVTALFLGLILMTPGISVASGGWDAERIHFESTVVDTHNDTMMRVVDPVSWMPAYDLYDLNRQINLQKVKTGGLDVAI